MTTTRAWVDGLHALAQQDLPVPVRAVAHRALLETTGAAVGAAADEHVERLVRYALSIGGTGPCALPGRRERLDAPSAALVVGVAARAEAVGVEPVPAGGPAAVVVAAALPVLARRTVEPGRLLDALALGLEAQLRLGRALGGDVGSGWDPTGTRGPVGAAVTAGVLLRLDADRLRHAVAIASSTTLGHGEALGTPVQAFHAGKAAANGLLAAVLAAHGSTGAEKALEGPRGLFRGLRATGGPEELTDALGTSWHLLDDAVPDGEDDSDDAEPVDARTAALVERTLPGRGRAVVRALRDLPDQADCSSLLTATSPETT